MNKLLISAGAVAALALTSAPAAATPVSASANAQAKIYRPLTITKATDLNFATVVLGTGTYSNTITVSQPVRLPAAPTSPAPELRQRRPSR